MWSRRLAARLHIDRLPRYPYTSRIAPLYISNASTKHIFPKIPNYCKSQRRCLPVALHACSFEPKNGTVDTTPSDDTIGMLVETLSDAVTDPRENTQLLALRCLENLAGVDASIFNKSSSSGLVKNLLQVLEEPYKKSLWKFMNSCVWTAESIGNTNLDKQRMLLACLELATRASQGIRAESKSNEALKETLLKIYLCHGVDDPQVAQHRKIIKDIFFNIGFSIRNIQLEPDGANGTSDSGWSWDKLIPFKNGKSLDAMLQETCEDPSLASAPPPSGFASVQESITWVPYSYGPRDNVSAQIIKYIGLWNLSEILNSSWQSNLDGVTIDFTGGKDYQGLNFGVLAFSQGNAIANVQVQGSLFLNETTLMNFLMKRLRTLDESHLDLLNTLLLEAWQLLSTGNIRALHLLNEGLDLDFISRIIEPTVGVVDNAPAAGGATEAGSDVGVDDDVGSNTNEASALSGLAQSKFATSVVKYMWPLVEVLQKLFREYFKNCNTTDLHISTNNQQNSAAGTADVDVSSTECVEPSPQEKTFHGIISGLLLDLLYLNDSATFIAMHGHVRLINALKRIRSMYSDLIPANVAIPQKRFKDTLASQAGTAIASNLKNTGTADLKPLLDKCREDKLNKTRVISPIVPYKDSLPNPSLDADANASADKIMGIFKADLDTWRMNFYKRQNHCDSSNLAPMYNCNKLLNILGHHRQPDFSKRGIRILSLDGGGTKGIITLDILARISEKIKMPIHEAFDFICGVSTGGFLAALFALERVGVEDIQRMFDAFIKHVFVKDSYHVAGTRLLTKYALYDDKLYRSMLQHSLGDFELVDYAVDPSCPKFFCISAQLDTNPLRPVLWRNYNYPTESCNYSIKDGSCVISLVDAIRATTAAPGFFTLYERNNNLYGDGALHSNNPSLVALLESKLVYPNSHVECLVSIGNGTIDAAPGDGASVNDYMANAAPNANSQEQQVSAEPIVDIAPESQAGAVEETQTSAGATPRATLDINDYAKLVSSTRVYKGSDTKSLSVDKLFYQLVNAATNTDVVHSALNQFMPSDRYFRFDPPIPNVRIDETNPSVLMDLRQRTDVYISSAQEQERLNLLKKILVG